MAHASLPAAAGVGGGPKTGIYGDEIKHHGPKSEYTRTKAPRLTHTWEAAMGETASRVFINP